VTFELELIPTNRNSNTKKYKEKMKRRISIDSGSVVPQSFITKSKQRLKQHIDTVYLNNGDEFEIELFNPTQNKVLAKIELNGKSIGNGIILRPGERVFLERYLDEAKKFLFETYIVNGNNEDVKNAITNNGDITIKFFNEMVSFPSFQYNQTIWINSPGTFRDSRINTTNNPYEVTFTTNSQPIGATTTDTAFYSNNSLSFEKDIVFGSLKTKKSEKRDVETGRVEKGSKSDQSFTYDNSSFYSYPSYTNWWKIKPISQQILVKEDLKVFCTECGSKRKKDSYRYCPTCGTKY
jgi:hypothetical protein